MIVFERPLRLSDREDLNLKEMNTNESQTNTNFAGTRSTNGSGRLRPERKFGSRSAGGRQSQPTLQRRLVIQSRWSGTKRGSLRSISGKYRTEFHGRGDRYGRWLQHGRLFRLH